jgi:hypothetical protein
MGFDPGQSAAGRGGFDGLAGSGVGDAQHGVSVGAGAASRRHPARIPDKVAGFNSRTGTGIIARHGPLRD